MPKLNDRFWLISTIVAVMIVTSLPLLAGYLQADQRHVFLPRVAVAESDTGAYWSNIEQVRQGRILLSNQFTSEVQQPSLFDPLWIVLGWLAWLFHISTPIIFQLARLAGIVIFVLILDRVIRSIPMLAERRWMTLWLTLTSSGLSWIVPHTELHTTVDNTPIDLWVSEANTFLSLCHSILFIGSQLMIGFVLWQLWLTTRQELGRWWRWAGPALLLIGLIHPYDLFLLLILWVVWTTWAAVLEQWTMAKVKTYLGRWVVAWLWVVPVVVYYLAVVLRQPAMSGWLQQNYDVMGIFGATVVGFGLLLPLAILAAWGFRRQRWAQFLAVWVVVSLMVAYAPGVSIQRRMLNGIHIPMALLAAGCLIVWLRQKFMRPFGLALAIASVVLLSWTNVENLSGAIKKMNDTQVPSPHFIITRGEFAAMQWVRDHTSFDDVTLSDYWNGNSLSGLMARTVAQGHGNQTLHFRDRQIDWSRFTSNQTSPADRLVIVQHLRVKYLLWYGPHDGEGGYRPEVDPIWQLVDDEGDTQVYQLQAHLAERN